MTAQPWTIAIDGNEANVLNRVGSNVYAFELLSAMERQLRRRPQVRVVVMLARAPLPDMPSTRTGWRYQVVKRAPVWTLTRLPFALRRLRPHVFFSPGHYTPLWSPAPMVASIMDIAYEHFPSAFRVRDRWQLSLLTRLSALTCRHLLVISEATKADVHAVYHVPMSRMTVVPPAVKNVKKINAPDVLVELRRRWHLTAPYIVHVGTLQPRKNIARLVEAFELLRNEGAHCQLVFAGKVGWHGAPIAERIAQSPYAQDIICTGFVSDEERTALLAGAEVLACVGLYEGFGIPPLEAVALGVVPVVSTTTSLPEVVGPDGVLVDPYSARAIADGLKRVLGWTAAEKAEHVRVLARYMKRFSWEESAQKALTVLAHVAGYEL